MEAKDQVTPEAKLLIFTDLRQQWINTRESLTMQYRVFKRIGDAERLKSIEKELEKCETALDELEKMFAEMQGGKDGEIDVLPTKGNVKKHIRNSV